MGKPLNTNSSEVTLYSDVPPHVLDVVTEFLIGVHEKQLDLKCAHVRPALKSFLPLIFFIYGSLITIGVLANVGVFVHVIKFKLYKDPTYAFILNNALSDVVKCVFVLPLTLFVLVVQNWMLGELLCSFLPMIQDIPLHVTTLTFLLMSWDRYRLVRNPANQRLPSFVCVTGSWLTGLCLVLPYPIYIIYVDLGTYAESFSGIGICIVNLTDDMQEYMRGIFLIMYAGPMATMSYIFVKMTRELESRCSVIMYEIRHRESRTRNDSHSTTTDIRSNRGDSPLQSQYSRSSYRERCTHQEAHDPDVDVSKERRTQQYLALMVILYGVCLGPLMVLRLARLILLETYENTSHFDLIYLIFVWIAFVPTCSTPILYATWQMNSNSHLRQSQETVITAEALSLHQLPGAARINRDCRVAAGRVRIDLEDIASAESYRGVTAAGVGATTS